MKILDRGWRLLRLGLFVGAGATLTLVQACSATTRRTGDAEQQPELDADQAPQDGDLPVVDAEQDDDRWDVPLE